jgi:primosomal protein N' (replication factor Y)
MVGEPSASPLQAIVRWSPEGYAARELEDRRTARLPPAARVAELTGPAAAVSDLLTRLRQAAEVPEALDVLGPVAVDDETVRAVVRAPRSAGVALARDLKAAQAARSAKKLPGPVRIQVDPAAFG